MTGPLSITTCAYETLVAELGDPHAPHEAARRPRAPRRKPAPKPDPEKASTT